MPVWDLTIAVLVTEIVPEQAKVLSVLVVGMIATGAAPVHTPAAIRLANLAPPENIRVGVRLDVRIVEPVNIRVGVRLDVRIVEPVNIKTRGANRDAKGVLPVNIKTRRVNRDVRGVLPVNIRVGVRLDVRIVEPVNIKTRGVNRDVKDVMQAMVPRLVHQIKQVVGLVPKVRVLYQEAHAPTVLRANTKTKLLKALVNYVLRVNI